MERKKLAPGVFITTLDAEKFNRCRITIHLRYPALRRSATDAAVLPLVLERGYAGCPDMTELSRKLARLYGADLGVDQSSAGIDRVLTVDICGIKDRFALDGENLTREYADIAFGTIFEPYLIDGVFDPEAVRIEKESLARRLDEEGFSHTEHTCNEWNFEADKRGTAYHAALTAGMLLAMQDSSLDSAMFYDARLGVSIYGGLFHPLTREPFAAYYAFMAFNELYKRQNAVAVSCDTPGLYAVGAQKDGDCCLVLANTTPNAVPLSLTLSGCRQKIKICRLTDETHIWQTCALPETLNGYSFLCIILE